MDYGLAATRPSYVLSINKFDELLHDLYLIANPDWDSNISKGNQRAMADFRREIVY